MGDAALDDLGFAPTFDVECGAEFPGDGSWGCPILGFDRQGNLGEPFESRWGSPTVVRVQPHDADEWVGTFAAGGLGGLSGIYGCPSPRDLCVIADGLVYLVEVTKPHAGAVVLHDQVHQVVRVAEHDLVLFVRCIDIVALGVKGIAWRTQRLVVDDLWVRQAVRDFIICSGDNLGGTPEIEIDPQTGRQTAGTVLSSFWPPRAR
jgi:hypothetical protein